MKLGVLSNIASPATDIYRSIHPFRKLGYDTIVIDPEKARWYELSECDVLVVSRPNGTQIQSILAEFKRMGSGKKIIVDMDDNLHLVDKANPSHGHFSLPQVKDSVVKCMSLADHIIYSTKALQKYYAPFQTFTTSGKILESTVIPNAVDLELTPMRKPRPLHNPIRVLWRGSEHHKKDLETIRPFWNWILKDERYEVMMMGLQAHDVYTFFPGALSNSWNPSPFSYWGKLQDLSADVAIFPLEDTPFNQGKSNIFALEMLVNGVLPFVPFGFPEFNHPGVAFYEKNLIKGTFETAIADEVRMQKVNAGQEWILENRTLEKVNELRKQIVESL